MNKHTETAERIASAVEDPAITSTRLDALCNHVKDMVTRADLSHPETIRRVYPIVAEIVEQTGGINPAFAFDSPLHQTA